ncbi:hypothetical protein [Streptacidiphilus sp. P02-A3a]|uniref:hypothetical protein n=1 Tax=Streptacidiphilus sp. P02-A3a TaxID=2704468 RepID=UPI00351A5B9E
MTSTIRALEVLPLLMRGEDRVETIFAYDPHSAFHHGVLELLGEYRCRVLPWEQVAEVGADAVLSASENIDLPDEECPVLILPHGIGFQKLVPDSRGPYTRLSGLVPDRLLARSWLVVSHPDQVSQLADAHPRAADRTVGLGDPWFERLQVGLDLRESYRAAMGVGPGQRLVVISSTWGPTSLLGGSPHLPSELLAQLPMDEYRVALVAHPNITSWHGSWQLSSIQAEALAAGLVLVPPTRGWQAAVTAADLVIGDHGSVTLYAAALGTPVLLAAFGSDAVPGTAGSLLGRCAPRLETSRPLRYQVESAIQSPSADLGRRLAQRAFGYGEGSVDRLRELLYCLLKLPEPPVHAPSLAFPAPELDIPQVRATVVTTSWQSEPDGRLAVTVIRKPAAVRGADSGSGSPATVQYLACREDEPDLRLAHSASVLIRSTPAVSSVQAIHWVRRAFELFPASWLTVARMPEGFVVAVRDGRIATASATGGRADSGLIAAAVYTCLRAGEPLDGTVVTLFAGGTEADVALRLRS